jgi:putative PIG3 family NAD(P)H quinone oxidoreductase
MTLPASMKALRVVENGGAYESSLEDVPMPVPKTGEILVRVRASGVNRADLSQIAGRYPPPAGESEILGMEISGTVVGTGERVCALLAGGGDAEYAAVPAGQIFPAPRSVELAAAAGIPEASITAYLNLVIEGGLARGGAALVHAAASGVGLAAIQTAKYLGARAAGTTRSPEKIPALREAGADLAIDTSRQSFTDAVESAWGKDAVSVILDPVGADTLAGDLRVLAARGTVVLLATMSGAAAELDIALLMKKRARVVGSTLRFRSREEKTRIVARFREEILPGFDSGALSVRVDSVYPPSRAAEAFTRMKRNENVGKILIDWGE